MKNCILLLSFLFLTIRSEESFPPIITFPIRSRTKQIALEENANTVEGLYSIQPAAQPPSPSKVGINRIGLMGNTIEYFAEILIGNPPQLFSLQVDTGSAITAIPNVGCDSCYHFNPLYNATKSPTSRVISCKDSRCTSGICNEDNSCKFSVYYADESNIHGKLVSDVISIPTSYSNSSSTSYSKNPSELMVHSAYSNTPFLFAAIDEQFPAKSFQYHGVDGIMGMAYDSKLSCVPNCVIPIMDSFVQKYKIPDIFSLSLQLIQNNTRYNIPGGSMTIGGIDSNVLGNSTVHYVPITTEMYYTIDVSHATVGGHQIEMEGMKGVVDSGTSLTTFPKDSFQQLVNIFQSNYCDLPFVCGSPSIFDNQRCINDTLMTEEVFNKFPTIEIYLDGVKTSVPSRQYLQKQQTTTMQDVYCFGIVESEESHIVLGNSYMQGFYIVFDRQSARVGFANDDQVQTGPKIISKQQLPIAIIVGAAAGGFILIAAIVVVIVIIIVKRNQRKKDAIVKETNIDVQII